MVQPGSVNGRDLRGMMAAATALLEHKAQAINALNVFPVPDGDTGTNMVLTLRASMEEAQRCAGESASAMVLALAHGALMGARGNSGVIFSQILSGMARALGGKHSFTGRELAEGLSKGASAAYRAVSRPVEGTMLTVVREAAAATVAAAAANGDLLAVLEVATNEARASVARTPSLLPVLRQAGVVDAGGQALYLVLEGARRFVKGEVGEEAYQAEPAPATVAARLAPEASAEGTTYGYCTEFLLQGINLGLDKVRARLEALGDSVMVVGDESTIRAHLHTLDPGAALSFATSLGVLRQVKVDNMQDQHREFLLALPKEGLAHPPPVAVGGVSLIAVASGEGLAQVLGSLGVTVVVPGGDTMNPSVEELVRAIGEAPSDKVVLLPNNPNVVMAARQAQALSTRKVAVLPTTSIPQGVAAALAFNPEADLEANIEAMEQARAGVHSGEITIAVRSMSLGDLTVDKGQAIGFLEGELVVAADSLPQALAELVSCMGAGEGKLVTIYYGAGVPPSQAESASESLQQRWPGLEIEPVYGGQPHYHYLVSVE